jgi:hypothetical protein
MDKFGNFIKSAEGIANALGTSGSGQVNLIQTNKGIWMYITDVEKVRKVTNVQLVVYTLFSTTVSYAPQGDPC